MTQPRYVLSFCGTSVLTNGVGTPLRQTLTKIANTKNKNDLGPELLDATAEIEQHIKDRRSRLLEAPLDEVAKLSAELNAICKLYQNHFQEHHPSDHHILLCTDTWLGEETAHVVEDWLRDKGFSVNVVRHPDLQTNDLELFQSSMADLVTWCDDTLILPKQQGYRIIFNLTGGFKSVQGFLQTLAMFYSDESIYVFESGQDLLRLPRLPVVLDTKKTVADHLHVFRRLDNRLTVNAADCSGIPETLWFTVDQACALSPWGELVWRQERDVFYQEQLLDSLSSKLVFSETFRRSVKDLPDDRLKLVNQRLDQLARYLEQGHHVSSLDFKHMKGNPVPPSTHECDAWSDGDARRLFGHFDGSGVFVVDRLGEHL